jgi:SAM-dependent methyltransferase
LNPPVAFDVSGPSYDRFMGRYSRPLAPLFADFAGVEAGMRVLDVGAGAGALTTELAARLGADHVVAAEPSRRFVEELQARLPGVEVENAPAERLPFDDATFDVALAQLVVSFMADAPVGVGQMARVVRPGGRVALCMWDLDRMGMLRAIAQAGRKLDPGAPPGRERLRWRTKPELLELLERIGLDEAETGELTVESTYPDFDDFWEPLLASGGPASDYVRSLDDERRSALREELRAQLGELPFTLQATAWAVRGRRPAP